MEASKLIFIVALSMCYVSISYSAQPGEIGSSCTRGSDCIAGNSIICRDNICTCSDNTVPAEDNRRCYANSGHDQPCLLVKQCSYSENTECIQGRCQCKDGYRHNGTKCIGTLILGDRCEKDTECTVLNDPGQKTVMCFNKQCSCALGYARESNYTCVVGGDCTTDKGCENVENSFCNTLMRDRAKCACNNNFVLAVNNTKCLPTAKKVGEGCQDKSQCTQNLGKAECVNQHCQCEKDARANDDDTKCNSKDSAVTTVVSISCLAFVILAKFL